jgi:hypothetical protein
MSRSIGFHFSGVPYDYTFNCVICGFKYLRSQLHLDASDRLICELHGNEQGARALSETQSQNARMYHRPTPLKKDI